MIRRLPISSLFAVGLSLAIGACSAGGDAGSGLGSGSGGSGSGSGSGGSINVGSSGGSGASGNKPLAKVEDTLPVGFTEELTGGWKVIGALADFDEPTENACANVLRIIARDFTQAHVDFGQQKPASWADPGLYQSQILPGLAEDRKPDVNPARSPLDVIESFDDWYRNVENVNVPYVMDLWLEPDPNKPGYYVFDSNSFFPLDAHNTAPADVQTGADNAPHDFLFTTELHTAFEYKGGEVFNFRGDDDVFVFVNGKLAVDIGGIHGPLPGNVNLDARAAEFGIELGNVYKLDLFQAERNPSGSNFRIETSLDFKECGILPDDVVK